MEKASKMIKATASETQVDVSILQTIKQNWDQHLTKMMKFLMKLMEPH